jgi:hypothetical protein
VGLFEAPARLTNEHPAKSIPVFSAFSASLPLCVRPPTEDIRLKTPKSHNFLPVGVNAKGLTFLYKRSDDIIIKVRPFYIKGQTISSLRSDLFI